MASDAAAAEEVLAQLEADHELAESVGGVASSGMTEEEQALYDELMRESGTATPSTTSPSRAAATPEQPIKPPPLAAEKPAPRRSEPEAG
jgi:hypothetical protein